MEIADRAAGRPSVPPLVQLGVPLVLMAAMAAFLYHRAILWWYYEWTANGTYYAHGIFVPFFVAAMIWRDRERLRRLPVERDWWGLAVIAVALALLAHGYRAEVTATQSLSFVIFIIGATMVSAGRKLTRALIIPILFLLTMIPVLPNQVINKVAFPIQLNSAKLAATILNVIGFGNVRYGTQVQLEHYNLNVEVPCSGFKTLVGLMSFAGAFAYLVEAAQWKRWFLFLMSIPLAILVNGVRIALIGLVGELVSSQAAMTFHDWSGFLVLILGFMVLFSTAKALRCESLFGFPIMDPPANAPPPPPKEEQRRALVERMDGLYGPPRVGNASRLALGLMPVLLIMTVTCVARPIIRPVVVSHPVMPASAVPVSLGNGAWERSGEDVPITPEVQQTLQPDVYLNRIYTAKAPATGAIELFITGGRSRYTFHDPHECFVGSGMLLTDKGVRVIQTDAGPLYVQEALGEEPRAQRQELMFFAFVVDGRMYQTIAGVHAALLRQTFFGSRGRPFYLVRMRQMVPGTTKERVEELESFAKAVWPHLAPHMIAPDSKDVGE